MRIDPAPDIATLTEKEKQTLRLMVRGHDAKSIARNLNLSVHTINERLRDARRKLAVSSSREAARLLLEAEHAWMPPPHPENIGDSEIGADQREAPADEEGAPLDGAERGRVRRPRTIIIGGILMSFAFALLALATAPNPTSSQPQHSSGTAIDTEVVNAARRFLTLLDQGRWDDSYQATGSAFQKMNTLEVWSSVSEKVRPPLGPVVSRTLLSQENLPAPPAGYEVVKFRTSFAKKAATVETVTLDLEDGAWRIVGITIG